MHFGWLLSLFFILHTTCFLVSSAIECKPNNNNATNVAYTITVSQSGEGNFTTINDAINSIPLGNDQWIRIYLMGGIYKEQINIPEHKDCIFLEGHATQETTITYDNHTTTKESITFAIYADNFVAKRITFKNSYNRVLDVTPILPAVALQAHGDKHAFYLCNFEGYQDTLCDDKGRHYFKSCYIEGAVDFIWGNGQSMYETCAINVTGDGFITAQGRQSSNETSGYVFDNCNISGIGHAVLGRAYGPFSRVIFKDSRFDNVINPEGWLIWNQHGHENDITFAEVNCSGPGAQLANSTRIPWVKKLNDSEVQQYTTNAFINTDGWIDKLPCLTC